MSEVYCFVGTHLQVFQNICLLQYARRLPTCHLCVFNGMYDLACMRDISGWYVVFFKGGLHIMRELFPCEENPDLAC